MPSYLRIAYLLSVLLLWSIVPTRAQVSGGNPSEGPHGTLTVLVQGLERDAGRVHIALTDKEGYETDDDLREASLWIEDGRARWTVESVPHGTYAVRLYHDENGNDELDTNHMGVPQEAYGFSNDARGSFGPPSFDEAAFKLASDSLSLIITAK